MREGNLPAGQELNVAAAGDGSGRADKAGVRRLADQMVLGAATGNGTTALPTSYFLPGLTLGSGTVLPFPAQPNDVIMRALSRR